MTDSTAREIIEVLKDMARELKKLREEVNAVGIVVQNYTEDNALYADMATPDDGGDERQ